MVIYANEFETKEKQKLPEIKKINCNRVFLKNTDTHFTTRFTAYLRLTLVRVLSRTIFFLPNCTL